MWVKADLSDFNKHDPIRVEGGRCAPIEGKFLGIARGGRVGPDMYVRLYVHDEASPITLWSDGRTWYRWGEYKPIDESRLRLNQPDPMAAEVEAAEAHLLKRIEKLEQTVPLLKARAVIVGKQTYVLNEGDHLRVWWEDGHLYTEFIQEVRK